MWLYREGPGLVLAALCAIGLTSTPAPAEAQGGTASATMNGKVSDATGGALPGVTVTAKNLATNQSRTVVTNEEGRYTFGGLHPAATRFSASCRVRHLRPPEITVNVGSVVTIDVTMRVSTFRNRHGDRRIADHRAGAHRSQHAHHQGADRDAADQQPQLPRFHAAHAGDRGKRQHDVPGYRPERRWRPGEGRLAARRRVLEHRRVVHLPAIEVQPGCDCGVPGRQPGRNGGVRPRDRRHRQRRDEVRHQPVERLRLRLLPDKL